jgi:D-glycero-D-manno-heptose 1,7-bisphosphate phosphatase
VTTRQFKERPPLGERRLPDITPEKLLVSHRTKGRRMVLTRLAQTPHMAMYIFYIKGKPTYLYVMDRLNPATSLYRPSRLFAGRKGLVLTDRDGPLDKTSAFLNAPDKAVVEASMVPAALLGAKRLHEAGIGLAVVTNQGGFQVGAMSFEDMLAVNVRIAQQIADAGGHLDAIFICPFSQAMQDAEPDDVDARKPSPGQLLYAGELAADAGVPVLAMLGDQRTDGAAAQRARVPFFALTDTVNGRWQAELDAAKKKGEELPELDESPERMVKVHDFVAATDVILAKVAS